MSPKPTRNNSISISRKGHLDNLDILDALDVLDGLDLQPQLQPKVLLVVALDFLQAAADGGSIRIVCHCPFQVHIDMWAYFYGSCHAIAQPFAVEHRQTKAIEDSFLGEVDSAVVVVSVEITGLPDERERAVFPKLAVPCEGLAHRITIGIGGYSILLLIE